MTDTPDISIFQKHPLPPGRPRGELSLFFDSLAPNTPAMLPEPWASKESNQLGNTIDSARHRVAPAKIVIRTFNGKIWACLIPAEEQ